MYGHALNPPDKHERRGLDTPASHESPEGLPVSTDSQTLPTWRDPNGRDFPPTPFETALLTEETFTRAQLADAMSMAYRWGYEARIDEEEAAWPPSDFLISGGLIQGLDRKARRDEWDAAANLPRPGDFRGLNDRQVAA